MISMRCADEESSDSVEPSGDQYPYGLQLSLDDDSLEKLGFSEPPQVGTSITICAKCKVTRAASSETMDGEPEFSSAWQITEMDVLSAGASGEEAATILYGNGQGGGHD